MYSTVRMAIAFSTSLTLLLLLSAAVLCMASSSSHAANDSLLSSIGSSNASGDLDDDNLTNWIDNNFPIAAAADALIKSGSSQCVNDTRMQLAALRNALPWAVKMYESSGSLTDKLLIDSGTGNVQHEMGLFDECLAAISITSPVAASFNQAKYCTVFFDSDHHQQQMELTNNRSESSSRRASDKISQPVENMSNFVKPSVAFCIPSSCTADDLRSAIALRLPQRRPLTAILSPSTSEDFCYTQNKIIDDKTFTTGAIITCCVIGLLIIVTIVATIHESFWHRKSKKSTSSSSKRIIKVLHCFSARKNSHALLSTQEMNDKDNHLSCLHGIRFICMFLLIAFHSQYKFSLNIYNFGTAMKNLSRWDIQYLANGTIFVDTFFLMSGLLVCLSLMRQLDRNSKGSFNVWRYYLHRYVRLTPLYALVIALVAFILPLANNGPDWHYVKKMAEATRHHLWWGQLLYINNYVSKFDVGSISPQSGMIEAWYLACDMQMYWLSPLLIYPLWRWNKAGLVWVLVCLFTLLGASMIPFIQNPKLLPTLLVNRPTPESVKIMGNYWDNFYTQTYCRLPPYIIGILLGWLLHKTRKQHRSTTNNIQLSKVLVAVGWIISIAIALVSIHGLAPFFDQNSFYVAMPNFNSFMRICYGAFHRSAFVLAIAWIIFACTRQYGGVVNAGLSWKVFMPLSRLCYSAYLINLNLIKVSIFSQRNPSYMSDSQFLLAFLGFLLATFLLSFVASLIVEVPFLNLNKIFLADNKHHRNKKVTPYSSTVKKDRINQRVDINSNDRDIMKSSF